MNSERKVRIIKNNETYMCSINMNYLPIELFNELNIKQLRGFIATKNIKCLKELNSYFKCNSLSKQPNKGKVDHVMKGNNNLIKLAFDSHNKKNILVLKSFEELLFPISEDACEKFVSYR